MTCKRTQLAPGVVSWSCSRSRRDDGPPCVECKAKQQAISCGFELRGRLAGKRCDRRICGSCAVALDGVALCPAHARLVQKERANG